MKRIITSTLLLSALALFSACQKSEQQAPAKGESIVFTASFAPETKTVIDKTGKKSLWNQDEIRIFNGNHSEAQEYVTTAVKAATAEFTIKNPEATFTGTSFIAVCPNSLATKAWWNGSVDKTINKLYLKPEQTATVGTYDPEGHVAVAYTENTALSFKNACALLKFTIKSDNIKEVCVYSTGAVLSGNFNFNTVDDNITTTGVDETDIYETNNYVKVKGDFVNGQTYYMSCIPATLENGLTLEVVNTNGKKGKDRTTTNKIELKRSKIYDLGEVKYEERPLETRTFYLKAGDWDQANAVIDAWIWGVTSMWVDFERIGEKEFKAELPKGTTGIKLYRRSPEHKTHEFDNNHWNTSGDLTITDANDCLTFKNNWKEGTEGWEVGNYSK